MSKIGSASPSPIFPLISNVISLRNDEIQVGSAATGPNAIRVNEILTYFLEEKNSSKKLPEIMTLSKMLKTFALLFLKLNNMICARLKCQKLIIGLAVSNFACRHLADILIQAGEITGLQIILADHTACIVASEVNASQLLSGESQRMLAVNVYNKGEYCCVTLYAVSERGLEILESCQDWVTGNWNILKNFTSSSYSQALSKIKKLKGFKGRVSVVVNCNLAMTEYIIKEVNKLVPVDMRDVVVGRGIEEIKHGILTLAQNFGTAKCNQSKPIGKILTGGLLPEVGKRMEASCRHNGYNSDGQVDRNLVKIVQDLARKDQAALVTYKKNLTDILHERMSGSSNQGEKCRCAKAIHEIDTAPSKTAVDEIKEKPGLFR